LIDGNRSREILTRLFGTISFGVFAVDGFFLLSGYLITQSYLQSKNSDYLIKRVLRIYPAFIIAFFISIGLGELSLHGDSGINIKVIFHDLFNLIFLLGPLIKNPYPGSYYPDLNGAMWTISYEFHCYLFILVLGLFSVFKRRLLILLLGFALLSIYEINPEIYVVPVWSSTAIATGSTAYVPQTLFRLLRSAVIENYRDDIRLFGIFIIGSCFNLFRDVIPYKERYAFIAAVLVFLCLFSNHLAEIGLAVFGGYLVFWFALQYKPLAVSKIFNSTDLSYGIYLYGCPVQKTLIRLIPHIDPYILCFLTLFICTIIAYLSWTLIEKPCIGLKKRFLPSPSVAIANVKTT
jgi:peptidoglycan/LPS O-acetylase OafA/YrhL